MIKAILFDLDGVLTISKTGSETIIGYLSEKTGISKEILGSCYYSYNEDLLSGTCTHEDMWNEFCEKLQRTIPYELLQEAFENTELNLDMIELVKQLHKKYKIGMVTDNKADRIEAIVRKNKLEPFFDQISVSASIGSRKTEEEIFKKTIEALQVQWEECIFIDNSKKNLVIPKRMGMQAIWFDDEKKDVEGLKRTITKLCKESCELDSK
ncbi:probable hydrolase, haloacid dehalogenase-like family [Lachnospiraceae bacterium KM106-2]|nr:probable hydrolase, haloacid dehalogenase-like family [Lachnospiraceae bacterium KM106-2]